MSAAFSDSRTNGRHRVEVRLIQVHPIQPDTRNCDRIRTFTLHDQHTSVILGRASKNRSLIPAQWNLWVESPIITKEHARFIRGPSVQQPLLIRDLNSTHGTYVAGERVSCDHPVCEGDLVQFGDYISNGPLHFEPPTFLIEYTVRPVSAPPTPMTSSPNSADMPYHRGRSVQTNYSNVADASSSSSIARERGVHASTFAVPDISASDSEDDSSHYNSELVEETDCPDSEEESDVNAWESMNPHRHDISDDEEAADEDQPEAGAQNHGLDDDETRSFGYDSDSGSISNSSEISRASLPPTQPSPPRERQFLMFDVDSPGSVDVSDESDDDNVSREAVLTSDVSGIKSTPANSQPASPNRESPLLSASQHSMSIQNFITLPDSPKIAPSMDSTRAQLGSVHSQHGASPKDPIILDGVSGLLGHGKKPRESSYRPRSPDLRNPSLTDDEAHRSGYYDGLAGSLRISSPLTEAHGRQPSPSDAAMAKPQFMVEPVWKPAPISHVTQHALGALDFDFGVEGTASARNVYQDGPFQRPSNTDPTQSPPIGAVKSDSRLTIQELINPPIASSPPRKRNAFEAGFDNEISEIEDFGDKHDDGDGTFEFGFERFKPMRPKPSSTSQQRESFPRSRSMQCSERDDLEIDEDDELDMDFDPTMHRSELTEQRKNSTAEVDKPGSEDSARPVIRNPHFSSYNRALEGNEDNEKGASVADDKQEASQESGSDLRSKTDTLGAPAATEDDTVVSITLPTVVQATSAQDARPRKRVKIQAAAEPTPRPRFKHLMSKAVPFMAGAAATAATIFAGASMLISTMHEELRQEALRDLGF